MSIVENGTTRSYEEAMRISKTDEWKKATDNEYTAIINNNTYRLVPLPKYRKSVTTKWIYKIKYHTDGTVDCYKVLWVARGLHNAKVLTTSKLHHQWYVWSIYPLSLGMPHYINST